MHDIEIDGLDNIDIVNSTIEIETGLDNVDIKYDSSALIDIDPYEYYLTSSGIYTGRLDGDVPTWLADYITTQLSTNEAIDNNAIINILKDRLNNAEIGINQNLQSIQTTNLSLDTLETSVVSRLDDNEADILELDTTKVTADEALAIATNLQVSTFGSDVEAFVSNIVTTYANVNLASASDYSLLVATYNDLSVTLTDTRQVVIGETVIWDGIGTPTLGSLYEISGVWYQYLGGSLGPNNDGWVETPTAVNYGQGIDNEAAANRTVKYFSQNTTPTAEGIGDIWMDTNIWYLYSTGTSTSFSDTGFGNVIYIWDGSYWMAQPRQSIDNIANVSWVAYASSLIHAPDGSITGWEYADGSTPYGDTTSQFAIYADNFKLSNGTTGYSPFSVDTINGRINFDGYVSFTGLGIDSDSTTIDGGKLTTNTAWIGGIIQSTNFEWTSGNEPIGFAASGEGIEDPDDIGTYYNIVGGDIYGGVINGSEIIASPESYYMRTSAGYLTKPIVFSSGRYIDKFIVGLGTDEFLYDTEIYTYNSTYADNYKRLVRQTNILSSKLKLEIEVPSGDIDVSFEVVRLDDDIIYNAINPSGITTIPGTGTTTIYTLESTQTVMGIAIPGYGTVGTVGTLIRVQRKDSTHLTVELDADTFPMYISGEGTIAFKFYIEGYIGIPESVGPKSFMAINT